MPEEEPETENPPVEGDNPNPEENENPGDEVPQAMTQALSHEDMIKLYEARLVCLRLEQEKRFARSPWPQSPLLDDFFEPTAAETAALAAFAQQQPFRSDPEEFLAMVRDLVNTLSEIWQMPAPVVDHWGPWENVSFGVYNHEPHNIILVGRKSVLTTLFRIAQGRGFGCYGSTWWAINTFRKHFPRSFARLVNVPGTHIMTSAEHVDQFQPLDAEVEMDLANGSEDEPIEGNDSDLTT